MLIDKKKKVNKTRKGEKKKLQKKYKEKVVPQE